MNRKDFNLAVARATGESIETIAHRGFVLLTPVPSSGNRAEQVMTTSSAKPVHRNTCNQESRAA